MSKIVYRMENRRGEGPWEASPSRGYAGWRRFHGCRLPAPPFDGADEGPIERKFPYPREGLRCGVPSKALIRRWFDKADREWLAERDFECNVYEVDEDNVWIGGHQACCDKSVAKRIGALDPVSLAPISAE